MVDRLTPQQRSQLMGRVKGKHTGPERRVRSLLHRLGYRFTVNGPKNRSLPGRPDIVLPAHRTVVFVHGCFWHRHRGCKTATTPQSNTAYWQAKFARNQERDAANIAALGQAAWKVIVVWECELKQLENVAARLIAALPRGHDFPLPETIDDHHLVAETQSRYGGRQDR